MSKKLYDPNFLAGAKAFNWGLIGFGKVAVAHMLGIRNARHRLAGFSTSNAKIRSGDARDLVFNIGNIPGELFRVDEMMVVTDYREMLVSDRFDGFIIAAPTNAHAEVAAEAAKAGRPCFIEKPIAENTKDGQVIFDLFSAAKTKFVVGHVLPYFPAFAELMWQLVHRGVEQVQRLQMSRWVPWSCTDNQPDTVARGGFAKDLGVHDTHFLSCAGTAESVRVMECKKRYNQWQYLQFEVMIKGSNGKFIVDVGADPTFDGSFHHGYHVTFNDGDSVSYDGKHVRHNGNVRQTEDFSVEKSFGQELSEAAMFFRGESNPGPLAAGKAIEALQVLEAAEQSAPNKTTITLSGNLL